MRDYGNCIIAITFYVILYYYYVFRQRKRGNLSKSVRQTFIIVEIKVSSNITF